jgi:hypothetical protein
MPAKIIEDFFYKKKKKHLPWEFIPRIGRTLDIWKLLT